MAKKFRMEINGRDVDTNSEGFQLIGQLFRCGLSFIHLMGFIWDLCFLIFCMCITCAVVQMLCR